MWRLTLRCRHFGEGEEIGTFAQFIGVCSNAKTCEIGENLLSVSDPILRPQERLIYVGALVRPRTLQRRPVSRLHPYVAMERGSLVFSGVEKYYIVSGLCPPVHATTF